MSCSWERSWCHYTCLVFTGGPLLPLDPKEVQICTGLDVLGSSHVLMFISIIQASFCQLQFYLLCYVHLLLLLLLFRLDMKDFLIAKAFWHWNNQSPTAVGCPCLRFLRRGWKPTVRDLLSHLYWVRSCTRWPSDSLPPKMFYDFMKNVQFFKKQLKI